MIDQSKLPRTWSRFNINKHKSVHSGRLERWLGTERIEQLSANMVHGGGPNVNWYGPPINLMDVPGSVFICGDGDFIGDFDRGFFHSAYDSLSEFGRRLWKEAGRPIYSQEEPTFGVGFPSIGDALSRASQGYGQTIHGNILKTGTLGVAAAAFSLWNCAGQPAAGGAAPAAPGGRAPTSATLGTLSFSNPVSGTLHLIGADFNSSVNTNSLMLYDRIFDVAKTMSSTANESVTGDPTRYQGTTTTDDDYVGGNFIFTEVITALGATAHNWSGTYTNQDGTNARSLTSTPGFPSSIANRIDLQTATWFIPLAAGDVGIKTLDAIQCSASVTGAVNIVLAHPIAFMTIPTANTIYPFDWMTNRNFAPRIFDNAALALMELPKPNTTATTYSGRLYALNAAA